VSQKKYETDAIKWLSKYIPMKPIDYPVNVKMEFYMDTRRIVDLVNLQEACLDALVKAKILKDDNSRIVVSMDGSRVLYGGNLARTEIEIEEIR